MKEVTLAVMVATLTLLTGPASSDPSRRVQLNLTRPRAFDLAAEAESVVGTINHNFSCGGRGYGYYADQNHNCQVFHICMPVQTPHGRTLDSFQFSFFCPSQTVFSQDSRTCISKEHAFPCHKAHDLYDLNKHIGKRPNKKRPVKLKASVGGSEYGSSSSSEFTSSGDSQASISSMEFSDSKNHKSSFSSHSSSSGSSSSENHRSSGTSSLLKNQGTPVHVESEVNIGASVTRKESSSFSSRSTNLLDHRVTESNSAGFTRRGPNPPVQSEHSKLTSGSTDVSRPTTSSGALEPIIPPGSQIFSTVSINRQNAISRGAQKDRQPSANFGTASLSSSGHDGSPGSSGFRTPAVPGSPQVLTNSPSPTITTNINSSPVPALGTGSHRHQINTRTLSSPGPSRVVVNKRPISSRGHSAINSGNNKRRSFSSSAVNRIPGSSAGSRRPTPPGAHPSHSAAHDDDFEFMKLEKENVHSRDSLSLGSHTIGSVTGTESISSASERSQGSSLSSRGRTQSSPSGASDSSNNRLSSGSSGRPSPGSTNRGSASFSSVASRRTSSSSVTPTARQSVFPNHQSVTSSSEPVIPTRQPVVHAHQVSPSRQPVIPTRQPVFPVSQPALPTRKTVLTDRVPGFSLNAVQGGEVRGGGAAGKSIVHPTSSTRDDITTPSEYDEEEDDYEALATTEAAFEAERNYNEAHFPVSRGRTGSSFVRGSSSTRNSVVSSGSSSQFPGSSASHSVRESPENQGSALSAAAEATSAAHRSSTMSTTTTRPVTRDRGKKKFQPSPYLLQLFKWGFQSNKNTNKFTPVDKQRSSDSRGRSRTWKTNSNTIINQKVSAKRQVSSKDESKVGKAIETASKSESKTVSSSGGVNGSGSLSAVQGSSGLLGASHTTSFHGSHNAQEFIFQGPSESSRIHGSSDAQSAKDSQSSHEPSTSEKIYGSRVSSVSQRHDSLEKTKEMSRIRGSAPSTNIQESNTSSKIRGSSPTSVSQKTKVQESLNTQGSTSSSGRSGASSRTRGSTVSGNSQPSNTGARTQELVRTSAVRTASHNTFTSNRLASGVEEDTTESDDFHTATEATTEYEVEPTTQPNFVDENEDVDLPATTYRPSRSSASGQRVPNTRPRALGSRGSTTFFSRNSNTPVGRSRTRSRGGVGSSAASTTSTAAPAVTEQESSRTLSHSNSRLSRPTASVVKVDPSSANSRVTPVVTTTAAPVTISPLTRVGGRRRVAGSSQTQSSAQSGSVSGLSSSSEEGGNQVSSEEVGGGRNSQTSESGKAIKKNISKVFPVSRGTRRFNTATLTTQAPLQPETSQNDQEKQKQRKALETLARFNPGLANSKLLSVRFTPNVKDKSERNATGVKKIETSNVRTSQPVTSSRAFSSQRGNPGKVKNKVVPAPVTTPLPSRSRSRGRLRPLTVRPSVAATSTTVAPTPSATLPTPSQRSRSSGRSREAIVSKDSESEREETRREASSSTVNSNDYSSQFESQRSGNVGTGKTPGGRRKVLKKVTQTSRANRLPVTTEGSSSSTTLKKSSSNSSSSSSRNSSSSSSSSFKSFSSSSESSLSSSTLSAVNSSGSSVKSSSVPSGLKPPNTDTSVSDNSKLHISSSSSASSSSTSSSSSSSSSSLASKRTRSSGLLSSLKVSKSNRNSVRRGSRPNSAAGRGSRPDTSDAQNLELKALSALSTSSPAPAAPALPSLQPEAGALPSLQPEAGALPSPQPEAGALPSPQPEVGALPSPQPEAGTQTTRSNSRPSRRVTSRGRLRSSSNSRT